MCVLLGPGVDVTHSIITLLYFEMSPELQGIIFLTKCLSAKSLDTMVKSMTTSIHTQEVTNIDQWMLEHLSCGKHDGIHSIN